MGTSARRTNGSAAHREPPPPVLSAHRLDAPTGSRGAGDRVDPLIGTLYQAAIQPELWSAFLEDLAKVVRADAMILLAGSGDGDVVREIVFDVGTDARAAQAYRDYFESLDAWAEAGAMDGRAGTRDPRDPHASEAERFRTELYDDTYAPNGWQHGFGARIFEEREGIVASVMGHRHERPGAFSMDEMAVLARLVPHLRRALGMRRALAGIAAERDAGSQLLERVSVGTILVDERGRVVRANRTAQAMLEAGDGLRAGPDGVETAAPPQTAALRAAIAAATDRASDRSPGSRLRVTRPSGLRPYLLDVSAVACGPSAWRATPLAAILVTDGNGGTRPDPDALRAFYELTPAEAELTALLVRGLCLDEAAARRGVSRNTARGQLKRIFAKTGTNRQAELVRQVLQGPAGFTRR